jgi:hypothetical protein
MAQVGMSTPRGSLRITGKNESVSVPATGNTQLLEIITEAIEKVSFQVDNTVQALDAFIVEARVHRDAAYVTVANAAGDFSAPSGRILSATGALVTLAAAASGRFDMDVSGLYSVRVSASAAVDSAVVNIYAGGSQAGQSNANVAVTTGDIEIGAVELKNAVDDTRAKIGTVSGIATTDAGIAVTDPVANAALGTTAGAAVITDATGTVQQYLRGLVKLVAAKIGVTIADGDAATVGVTTGAAVITDANGTVQGYLRGLVKLWIAGLTAGEAHVGEIGGRNAVVVTSFTRPADTNVYASGDLVANSTVTQTVAPMSFSIGRGSSGVSATGMLRRVRVRKTGASVTNAAFRLHLWRTNIGVQATITAPVASPGIVTWTAHGLATGSAVEFTNSGGGLPTGITSGTTYYVIFIDANTFNLASSSANAYAGTQINFTGSSTGTHTGYQATPVGDNGVFVPTNALNYVGKCDVTVDQAFSDGASGNGVPNVGSEINFTGQIHYGLLEARGAYTPITSEVFTVELEVLQN